MSEGRNDKTNEFFKGIGLKKKIEQNTCTVGLYGKKTKDGTKFKDCLKGIFEKEFAPKKINKIDLKFEYHSKRIIFRKSKLMSLGTEINVKDVTL